MLDVEYSRGRVSDSGSVVCSEGVALACGLEAVLIPLDLVRDGPAPDLVGPVLRPYDTASALKDGWP